jgi:hypothetical protein
MNVPGALIIGARVRRRQPSLKVLRLRRSTQRLSLPEFFHGDGDDSQFS